jgi:glycosyltransferase involved in cell wall biosynthesis
VPVEFCVSVRIAAEVKVVGLYPVRNEVDIIELNLRHHLATVLDEAFVVDNGSTDGTLALLARLAGELPLLVASEPGAYTQSELVTRMARQASRSGADWLVPVDADEFWVGQGRSIRGVLETTPVAVGVLRCEVVNFVQRREELAPSTASLMTMVMRSRSRPARRSAAKS